MKQESKRLKIGIFMDSYYPMVDGVVVVIDNLASMLAKHNDVTVVVPYTDTYKEDYKKPYDIIRVKSVDLPFMEYNLGLPPLKHSKDYKRLLEKKFDIIHIHSPFTMGKLGLKIANDLNIPCIATVHTRYHFEVEKYTKSKKLTNTIMKKLIKVFNKCDDCIVVNEELISDIRKYGYNKNATVIYNGTDLEPLKDREKNINMINKLYDLKEDDTVLLFVGRINSVKNIFFLLEVLKLLKEDKIDFKMLYVGTGPDEKKLKAKIKEYKMEDNITMTGKIDSRTILSAIYARADLLLFPSIMDTSSLVRIEAATNETPGLFIENSMVGKTVKNNINGYTSALKEIEYKNRIKELLSNKKGLKKVGKNAQKTLGKNWQDVATETYEEYLKIIKNHGK